MVDRRMQKLLNIEIRPTMPLNAQQLLHLRKKLVGEIPITEQRR